MRIALLSLNLGPNVMYRAYLPTDELARRGHEVRRLVVRGGRIPAVDTFSDCDLVYLWQGCDSGWQRLAKGLKRAGIAVTWDSDDDVLSIPRSSPNYRLYGGIRGQRVWADMKVMIRTADAVTTPSPVLAQKFERAGQRHVRVIENFLPPVRPPRPKGSGRVLVGWGARMEHGADVGALGLRPALQRLLDERPIVEVESVCVGLGLEGERYRRTPIMDPQDYATYVARFHIGIAPIADTPFNRARSNIKVKEYAAAGVPWLASPIGPYAGLGEEQGGRLVDDDRWFDELLALVDDPDARRELAMRGLVWAQTQTVRANVDEWEQILEAAVSRARARSAGAAV